jgi:glycosyltransferase involved in cell wall biosynthesis
MNRRLLAVSWELPPMYGPRAAQVSRSLRELAVLGWEPTAIAMDPREGGPHWRDAIAPSPLAGVKIVRVPSPEEWWLVRAAWRALPPLRDRPDSKWVWIGRAARAALREAASGAFAGLVTFGQPWSDHLIGLRVSRKSGLPWVAHFSDPWVDSPYAGGAGWQRAAWRRMEAEVIGHATGVVFVTSETADLVMRKYPPEWRQKVTVVPHGHDASAVAANARRPGPLRLVHTGRFYSGIRTPIPFLTALAALNVRAPLSGVLEVTLVGPHTAEFKRESKAMGLDGIVRFLDRVPPADAAAIAADADVLLVIDAPNDGPSVFLPSKLIDYLPFRKPILGVTPPIGASASLLRRLGCRVASPDDAGEIADALATLIADWRDGRLAVSPQFDRVAADYDIRRTTTQLNTALVRAFDR